MLKKLSKKFRTRLQEVFCDALALTFIPRFSLSPLLIWLKWLSVTHTNNRIPNSLFYRFGHENHFRRSSNANVFLRNIYDLQQNSKRKLNEYRAKYFWTGFFNDVLIGIVCFSGIKKTSFLLRNDEQWRVYNRDAVVCKPPINISSSWKCI